MRLLKPNVPSHDVPWALRCSFTASHQVGYLGIVGPISMSRESLKKRTPRIISKSQHQSAKHQILFTSSSSCLIPVPRSWTPSTRRRTTPNGRSSTRLGRMKMRPKSMHWIIWRLWPHLQVTKHHINHRWLGQLSITSPPPMTRSSFAVHFSVSAVFFVCNITRIMSVRLSTGIRPVSGVRKYTNAAFRYDTLFHYIDISLLVRYWLYLGSWRVSWIGAGCIWAKWCCSVTGDRWYPAANLHENSPFEPGIGREVTRSHHCFVTLLWPKSHYRPLEYDRYIDR